MKRFKNILMVLNGDVSLDDNPAMTRAVTLAQQNGARLTLMDIVAPLQGAISEYEGIVKTDELTEMMVGQRQAELESLAQQLPSDIDVGVRVSSGKDFIEIVRQVVLGKHDLLMKMANEYPESFDSSDFHLMRKCPQPVWLFKPKAERKPQKVLAAIDLKLQDDDSGRALNTVIMDLASALAERGNSELHVLSCWSLYGESSLRNSGFFKVPEAKIEQLLEQEMEANRLKQRELLERYQGAETFLHLRKGNPVDLIPEFIRKNSISVVVMGTVARSGIPGLLIGNTAETILRLIDTSVITLKPSGFESPVK